MTLAQTELKKSCIGPTYNGMQGPCPTGFHVPSKDERQEVYGIWTALGGGGSDGTNFGIALKLPFAGNRHYSSADIHSQYSGGFYRSSSPYSTSDAYNLFFNSTALNPQSTNHRAFGFSVRCFKNSPTVPTSSWTKLYGTSIEAGGIFWSSTDGLISLSSDGNTWITIADNNLGATTVWNNGDTLSQANCGNYYQWGNNYGFPRTGSVTTSSTQVNASTYGPGNYYSSSTFITRSSSPYDWSSVQNDNLWGGQYTPIKRITIRPNGQEKQIRPEIIPAGIYHSSTLGLITIADGNGNDITIADKNLGATQVYNDGDTLSEANCGKYYQRGNNYGFPRTGTIANQSTTQVDASNYGPGNYYSSDTFIKNNGRWDTTNNRNLWGGETGTNEAMQGPAPSGFHVPLNTEWQAVYDIWTALGGGSSDGTNFGIALKLPFAGNRDYSSVGVFSQGTYAYYWSSTAYSDDNAYYRYFNSARLTSQSVGFRTYGYSIRCFKNEVVAPDNTWTKIYEKATPLCFTANTAGSTVQLNKSGNPTSVNLETSTDGTTWTDYTIGNTITLANVGDKVYMRNKSETATKFSTNTVNYYHFSLTGSVGCGGDISYLICKNGYQTIDYNYTFVFLFLSCSSLTSCPKLPFTETPQGCYYGMFQGCTNLETLPKIQTSQTNSYCFYRMFYRCTKIKLSQTQTGEYQTPYRVPTTGNAGLAGTDSMTQMFDNTGGTFTGLGLNTTYYTSNQVI